MNHTTSVAKGDGQKLASQVEATCHTVQLMRKLAAVTRCCGAGVIVLLALVGADSALAALNITGSWDGVGSASIRFPVRFAIVQTDGSITISFPENLTPLYTGTVDPETGALTFGGAAMCALGGGLDSFSGFVSPDGTTISVSGTLNRHETATLCFPVAATFSLTRLPCGDGVLDSGEDCDDGDPFASDCCTFSCHRRDDGAVCDDDDPFTSDAVCLNAVCTAEEPAPPACPGDCDGDQVVTVGELVAGVAIMLGGDSIDGCLVLDRDHSAQVTVDELVGAVRALLDGC